VQAIQVTGAEARAVPYVDTAAILAVSHRPAALARADQMIVLDAGRLAAAGAPYEVREKAGWPTAVGGCGGRRYAAT
jgi:ABC-type multidrug transport system fused ATPase/permease subunit